MNKEEIEKQLKLSKRQNKDERYDYLCSEFNGINYCINLEKYTNMLQQENKQLKDNWNNLKKIAKMHSGIKKKCYNGGLWFEIDSLLDKMKELEGSDSNE